MSMGMYVTGDLPCPPKFVASSSSTSTSAARVENPAYTTWYQQDKLIMTHECCNFFTLCGDLG
jgi:hypothetical protein